jgi:hypothetical protein
MFLEMNDLHVGVMNCTGVPENEKGGREASLRGYGVDGFA